MYSLSVLRGFVVLASIALSSTTYAASYVIDPITFRNLTSIQNVDKYNNGKGFVDYSISFTRPGLFKVSLRAYALVVGSTNATSFQWGKNYRAETEIVVLNWRWNGIDGSAPGASYQYIASGSASVNCSAEAEANSASTVRPPGLNFRSSGSTGASAFEARKSKSVAFTNVGGVAQAFEMPVISGSYTTPPGQAVGGIGGGLNDIGHLSQGGSGSFATEEWVMTPAGISSISTTVIYSVGLGLGMTSAMPGQYSGKGGIEIESEAGALAVAASITPYS